MNERQLSELKQFIAVNVAETTAKTISEAVPGVVSQEVAATITRVVPGIVTVEATKVIAATVPNIIAETIPPIVTSIVTRIVTKAISESEQRLRAEMLRLHHELRQEMLDGFAGIAEALEYIYHRLARRVFGTH